MVLFRLRPGGFAAPEERWFRIVSNRFITDPWLRFRVPILFWLTLQTIRFYCTPVMTSSLPFRPSGS